MNRREFLIKSTCTALAATTISSGLPGIARADERQMVLLNPTIYPRILVAPDARPSELYAANELAAYLCKISGQLLKVEQPTQIPVASSHAPLIVVGYHPLNADLASQIKGLEETIVDVQPEMIRLIGGKTEPITWTDNRQILYEWGTLYAVYNLLDELGVRWYRPEPWGEHVPQMQTIKILLGKRQQSPVYKYRWGVQSYRGSEQQTPEELEMAQIWIVRNRQNTMMATPPKMHFPSEQGGNHWLNITHMYDTLFPSQKYFAAHPEYFALIDGKRRKDGQLCISNHEVQLLTADKVVEFSKQAPQFETHSLEPLDNDLWCQCEFCKALDDPNQKSIWSGATIEWEKPMKDISMSNRVSAFGKIVAEKVAQSGQPIKVMWLGYFTHTEPPSKMKELPSNVRVMPAAFSSAFSNPVDSYSDYSRDLFDSSSKPNLNFVRSLTGVGKLTRMFTYEYWSGIAWFGPMPLIRTMKDRVQAYRKFPVDGIYSETTQHWGPQGTELYFFTRLLWNPDLDVEKELDLYCKNYYGPAYKPMLEYHQMLENAAHAGIPHHSYGIGTHAIFTPRVVERMGVLINQAKALTGDKQPYAQRFEGVWAGYEYTRLVMPYFDALEKGDKLEAAKHWERANKLILSYKDGSVFDNGVLFGSLQFFGNYNLNIPADIQQQAKAIVAGETTGGNGVGA